MQGPAYIDPTARIYGDVRLAEGCSLWPGAVLRSERNHIAVGSFANLQDQVIAHIGWNEPTIIGAYCSIGHRAVVHGCRLEEACLIGTGATIMERCVVGRGSIIAGHAFLPPDTIVPSNSLVMGVPGRVVRSLAKLKSNIVDALLYHENALAYARGEHRAWDATDLDELDGRAEAIIQAEGWA